MKRLAITLCLAMLGFTTLYASCENCKDGISEAQSLNPKNTCCVGTPEEK